MLHSKKMIVIGIIASTCIGTNAFAETSNPPSIKAHHLVTVGHLTTICSPYPNSGAPITYFCCIDDKKQAAWVPAETRTQAGPLQGTLQCTNGREAPHDETKTACTTLPPQYEGTLNCTLPVWTYGWVKHAKRD